MPDEHLAEDAAPASVSSDDLIDRYSLREATFAQRAEVDGEDSGREPYRFDPADGVWRRQHDTAHGEAILVCAGSAMYDRPLERAGTFGGRYEFRPMFRSVAGAVQSGDLAVGSLGTLVADMYPPMSLVPQRATGSHYGNARPEYLDALRYAGFDCLALANPYNLDAGVRGITATEQSVLDHSLVPSGLGVSKDPVFDVNGIRVAVLSFTLEEYQLDSVTDDGADRLLNVFDDARARAAITRTRTRGAEFVLAYLDCRSTDGQHRLAERRAAGRRLAELGADYVICTLPPVVSRFVRHRTRDGRDVSIATGLGSFSTGVDSKESMSALLRITLRRSREGEIEVEDSAIPLERVHGGADVLPRTIAQHRFHNRLVTDLDAQDAAAALATRIGDDLAVDPSRRTRISAELPPQMSPIDVAEALGHAFTDEDLAALGDRATEPSTGIVSRMADLRPGCVAIAVKFGVAQRAERITAEGAASAGAVMLVDTERRDGIPTLVVDDAFAANNAIMGGIRRRYAPLTAAITGTAGKTTTKGMMSLAFERQFRTLHVDGNSNTPRTISLVLQHMTADDEAYVQEISGGAPGTASTASKMIAPDICVITTIGEGHLSRMGTIENVIRGKMQITDGLKPGGVLIINDDNEYLHAQTPDVTTVRYSLTTADCEYRARNIRGTDRGVEFEIVSPDGVFDASIALHGNHNVSNALAAFAAGRVAGIPAHRIIAGMSRYRPSSDRQNIIDVGGYTILLDAYNSNVLSMTAALETLVTLPVGEGGRRIVVMGDMGEQGDKVEENHALIGERISALPVDQLYCVGEGSLHTARSAAARGTSVVHHANAAELVLAVRDGIRPGDTILFKAAGAVNLTETVVYPLFGRIS